jgi:formylglycine-generating enzyme required for sulfatase activity
MVVVPAGSFVMGSPESEAGRSPQEGPQHTVTIGKPFAIGKFTVTFDEWDACVAAGACNGAKTDDRGWGRGKQPVFNISWNDAQAYAAWISKTTGEPYRLLTEAEWEYAARAGEPTPFWWGSTISTDQANFDGRESYGDSRTGAYRGKPLPVDSFAPNGFGIYNMQGNVWQWVEDCARIYTATPLDGSAAAGGSCARRVLRGGAWNSAPSALRAANRLSYWPDYQQYYSGIRLARSLNS